jgi:hypothetical protein
MRNKKLYSCNTSFLDLLFNMLLAFTALFVLAFAMINQNKDISKSSIEVKAEFIVTMSWPDDMDNDIDLYIEDPNGNLVFFRSRESGLMHLDRDDLGFKNDTVETPQGIVKYPYNREIVTFRGFHTGEYCINAHAYKTNDKRPCPVTIQIDKINPSMKTLMINQITLDSQGEEKTIIRFKLNKDGQIESSNTIQKKMIGKHGHNFEVPSAP